MNNIKLKLNIQSKKFTREKTWLKEDMNQKINNYPECSTERQRDRRQTEIERLGEQSYDTRSNRV